VTKPDDTHLDRPGHILFGSLGYLELTKITSSPGLIDNKMALENVNDKACGMVEERTFSSHDVSECVKCGD